LENTLILYTSDHGDMTGDHHLWRKSYAYEASARIPMLMRWPKGMVSAGRGQVSDRPVEIRDIAATCLDAAGVSTAHKLDGLSMLNAARGRGGWRDFIDLEHDVCYDIANHWNALTGGKTKYIFHARSGQEQLFDVARDPQELTDLAGGAAHEPALRLWRNRLIAHFEERGERYLKHGRLAQRPERDNFSPLYPKKST
jgi:arylsulfatase A-like enzyme